MKQLSEITKFKIFDQLIFFWNHNEQIVVLDYSPNLICGMGFVFQKPRKLYCCIHKCNTRQQAVGAHYNHSMSSKFGRKRLQYAYFKPAESISWLNAGNVCSITWEPYSLTFLYFCVQFQFYHFRSAVSILRF